MENYKKRLLREPFFFKKFFGFAVGSAFSALPIPPRREQLYAYF